jgi:soluble lytic murein transglycosylase-like protein
MGMLLSALGSGAGYLADRLAEDHRLKEQDEIQKRRDQVIRQNALADRAEALAIKEADWEKQKAWETEKGNTNYAQTIARDQMNDKAAIDKEKELLPIKAQYEQQAYDRNHAGDKEYKEQYQQERLDMLRMQQEKLKQDQMDKIDAKIAELPQSATAQRQELERQKASLGKFQTSSYTGTPSKDSTIANVNKYDPLVKSLADKYSITPNEAKAIMIVESGGKSQCGQFCWC